jgi:hypothetical protein
MPQWIHDRAKHLREKNPDMPESQSWAIATQQAYAAGKAPKSYGTKEGRREAKMKYDDPKSTYKKTAMASFLDELEKISMATAVGVGDVKKLTPKITKPSNISVPQSGLEKSLNTNPDPIADTRTKLP